MTDVLSLPRQYSLSLVKSGDRPKSDRILFHQSIQSHSKQSILDYLCLKLPDHFSRAQIEEIFALGGVWHKKVPNSDSPHHWTRVRNPQLQLSAQDSVALYYDPNLSWPEDWSPQCLWRGQGWGAWYKPAGVLSQGTCFGDRGSLARVLERQVSSQVYIISQLDAPIPGLALVAYNQKVAAILSQMIGDGQIKRTYWARVKGRPPVNAKGRGVANLPLHGKAALTYYQVLKCEDKFSEVVLHPETAHHHQLRQHLHLLGTPILGDLRYGQGQGQSHPGPQLEATRLAFRDPFTGKLVKISVPQEMRTWGG